MAIKFTIPQTDLARGAQTVLQAVPTRSTLPALTNVHVEVKDEGLHLTATDLDTSVTLRLPCEESSPGRALVPARLFGDLVKILPPDLVTIESVGETIRISSRGGEFHLPTADPDDFPQLPSVERERTTTIPAGVFAGLVRKVVDFVSVEDNRPDLNGVLIEFRGKELRMVSTNGHLLSLASVSGDFTKGDNVVVLPSALSHVVHGMGAAEEVTVGIARTQIVFEIGATAVYSRLLEAKFPHYEGVIPTKNDKALHVRHGEVSQALRRVDVVADNITHQVVWRIDKGSLEMEAQQTVGGGRATVRVEAEYDADPMEVGFNAKYLMNVLKTIDSEEVELTFDKPLSGVIVKPFPEPSGGHHLCLVMPLRLK